MRKYLHNIALVLLVLSIFFDLVFWGAVPDLETVGPLIEQSASNEAFLASMYIGAGGVLDGALPSLGAFGSAVMKDGLADAFPAMIDAPNLAMDLIFGASYNGTHGWIKLLYWAPPVLFVLYLVLWFFRPKKVILVGRRR
jgi:hypothetical protein